MSPAGPERAPDALARVRLRGRSRPAVFPRRAVGGIHNDTVKGGLHNRLSISRKEMFS